MLETEGNEAFGQELLSASIELYQSGFHEDVRHTERYSWSLCYLLDGQTDRALDVLQRELDGYFTSNWPWLLRSAPYDAIREDPRFIALQSEFERRMAEQLAEFRRLDKAKRSFEF